MLGGVDEGSGGGSGGGRSNGGARRTSDGVPRWRRVWRRDDHDVAPRATGVYDDAAEPNDYRRPSDEHHVPTSHHYDGRAYHYVLYSDVYFDYERGDLYKYDSAYDLDNYRPDDHD
jgi:hypothetical protein